jgi:hypothetical protein
MQDGVEDGYRVEVVQDGRQYTAYTYRRHETVKIAFLSSARIANFGGAAASFSYPGAAFDVALLRIYEDGAPLSGIPHAPVQVDREAAEAYAVGFPERTSRSHTPAQLAFEREVHLPVKRAVQEALVEAAQQPGDTSGRAFQRISHEKNLKETQGRIDALRSDGVQARIQARFDSLRAEGGRTSALIDSLSRLQRRKRDLESAYRAFQPLNWADASITLRRALMALRHADAGTPADDSLRAALRAMGTRSVALDAAVVARHLKWIRAVEGADSLSAEARLRRARSIVEQSEFGSDRPASTISLETGPDSDPAVELLRSVRPSLRAFQQEWTTLRRREDRLAATLRQRLATDRPDSLALPVRRSLRVSDGRIAGYSYNGTVAPPVTTSFRLLASHHTEEGPAWQLPARWEALPSSFDRAVPLTLAAGTDVGKGMNGGGLLSANGTLVGMLFDQNVQGLASPYLYLPDQMRAVGVEGRGLVAALNHIYDASELVQEMTNPPSSTR